MSSEHRSTLDELTIEPPPPFDLGLTVRVLQRRPTNRVDLWRDNAYWRLLVFDGSPHLLSVRQVGGTDDPRLVVRLEADGSSASALAQAATTARDLLGVEANLAPFWALAAKDPLLGPYAIPFRGLKPPRFPTLWDTIVNVVVFQQISLLAALAIVGRMVERFGHKLEHAGNTYFTYPVPEAVAHASVADLRSLGLSKRKAEVLKELANGLGHGEQLRAELSLLTSDQAIERLVQLPGIGRWSAEVILLRGLGRLDVFPGGDSGVNRGLSDLMGRDGGLSKGEEIELAARFGPYRGMLYLLVVAYRLSRLGLIGGDVLAPKY